MAQGYKGLRRVLRSIPDTIHAAPSSLFQFYAAVLPAKLAMIVKNLIFDQYVISDVQIKVCNIFGDLKPEAIKCHFGVENRSSSLSDSKGVETVRPPSAGRVLEHLIGLTFSCVRGVVDAPLVLSRNLPVSSQRDKIQSAQLFEIIYLP